jgi:hypothetical protein
MLLETREQFLAFLAVMSYNKQYLTDYDPALFTVSSLFTNQNTEVAYEIFGKPTTEPIELRLRIYCNYGTINIVEQYRFVETFEDTDNVRVMVLSAYALLNDEYLNYTNNVVRQSDDLIINDPSLLPIFLEENGMIGLRLENGNYLTDENWLGPALS